MKPFKHVVVGGTFDPLHKGHMALLDKCFEIGEQVTIGLTDDKFVEHKGVNGYYFRLSSLKRYIKSKGYADYEVIPISDPIEPALDPRFQAIVVSPGTEPIARKINQERVRKLSPPLEVVVIPWVMAENGTPISSTAIRAGVMDTFGKLKKSKNF